MTNELTVTFGFETPPPADEIGDVFIALSRDYRDMTEGRVLVITRVESGSITATLTDAVLAAVPYAVGAAGVISAINSHAEFARNLKKWFGYAKSENGRTRLYRRGKKSPGQRSIEAIIKTAADTGSYVRVKHTTEKGEMLEVELTRDEAIVARKQRDLIKTEVRHKRESRLPLSAPEVRSAIEQLQKASGYSHSLTEVETLVDVVVAVLQAAGAGHLLSEIASELETHGLHTFADAMRRHIRKTGGTHEPPITTT